MTTATATTERYVEFVTLVATSPELSRQLEAASDAEGMVQLAAANGYSFTTDELKNSAHQARMLLEQYGDELSEQELEAVAGGFPGWGSIKKAVHAVRKAVDWIDNKLNG